MASFDAIAASLLAEGDDAAAVSQLDAVLVPDSAAPSQAPHTQGEGEDNNGEDEAADGDVPEIDLDYALSQLCLSESAAPELFQYEDIIVGRARRALRDLRRELARRKRAAAAASTSEDGTTNTVVDDSALPAASAVIDMERARLRYLLAWYHRLRLEKIEGLLDVLAAEARDPAAGGADRLSARLAPAELQLARDLHRLRVEHLDRAFGAALPAPYRVRDDEACAPPPDGTGPRTADDVRAAWDRTPVFVTIDADVGTVALDDTFEFVFLPLPLSLLLLVPVCTCVSVFLSLVVCVPDSTAGAATRCSCRGGVHGASSTPTRPTLSDCLAASLPHCFSASVVSSHVCVHAKLDGEK